MEKQLARLAVAQVALIVYAMLVAGMGLKCAASFHSLVLEMAVGKFAQHVRDYGIWMLLVPTAWSGMVFWLQQRPSSDHSTFVALYVSGMVVAVLLFFYAFRASRVLIVLFSGAT